MFFICSILYPNKFFVNADFYTYFGTAISIPLAVGGLSALLTGDGMQSFQTVNQPPLSPPAWLFPLVWTILYILMGIASYLVVGKEGSSKALTLYAVQLIFNFF